jgi:hypothetical protein
MSGKFSASVLWAFPRPQTPPAATAGLRGDGEVALFTPQAERQLGDSHDPRLGQTDDSLPPRRFAERLLANSLRVEASALGAP